jgi:hypothetical protein
MYYSPSIPLMTPLLPSPRITRVARVLTRCKRSDRVTVHHLLEKAGMTSVNRMAAATILMEMWRTMGDNSVEKESLAAIRSTSTLVTLSRTEGKLKVGHPQHALRTMVKRCGIIHPGR